ncbi:MAG: hypothetical protein AAFN68_14415 [Pseudomonadota bacterium]
MNPVMFNEQAERLLRVLGEIAQLEELPKGWNAGRGEPISTVAAALARSIAHHAVQEPCTIEVFPLDDGGLTVSIGSGIVFLDIDVHDETCDLRIEKGIGADYVVEREEEGVSLQEALEAVRSFCQNYLRESYPSGSTASERIVGKVMRSHHTKAVRPVLIMNAPNRPRGLYAGTYMRTTPVSLRHHSSRGYTRWINGMPYSARVLNLPPRTPRLGQETHTAILKSTSIKDKVASYPKLRHANRLSSAVVTRKAD